MSDFVVKRRRSRYTGPVDPCLGYYVGPALNEHVQAPYFEPNNDFLGDEERFVPSSVPSELELELHYTPTKHPAVNMDFEEAQNAEQQEETGSIIDADWSVLASHKPSTVRKNRGHVGHANEDPDLLDSHQLTVEGFLKQAAKIDPKKINKYGKRKNRASSDGRKSPSKRKYCTLRRVQDSSDCPTSGVEFQQPAEAGHLQPQSNQNSSEVIPDEPSSEFNEYSPSPQLTSSPFPSPARHSPAKRTKRTRKNLRTKRKPLRTRLYEAAISTHVDPEAAFAQEPDDVEAGHRIPLRFLPETSTGAGVDASTPFSNGRKAPSNWSLVDPRKSRAIQGARFPAMPRLRVETGLGSASLSNTLDRLPIDSWSWDAKLVTPSGGRHAHSAKRLQKKPAAVATASGLNSDQENYPRPTCIPLVFVPLDEASISLGKDSRHRTRSKKRRTSKKQEPPTAAGLSMVNVQEIVHKTREPRDENEALKLKPVLFPRLSTVKPGQDIAAPSTPPRKSATPLVSGNIASEAIPRTHQRSDDLGQSALRSSNNATGPLRSGGAKRKAYTGPLSQSSPLCRLTKRRKLEKAALISRPATTSYQSVPDTSKPLKPLVSFMDQFLENLRSVSTNLDSGVPKGSNTTANTMRPSSKRLKPSDRIQSSGTLKAIAPQAESIPDAKNDEQIEKPSPPNETSNLVQHIDNRDNVEHPGPDLSTLFGFEHDYRVLLSSPTSSYAPCSFQTDALNA